VRVPYDHERLTYGNDLCAATNESTHYTLALKKKKKKLFIPPTNAICIALLRYIPVFAFRKYKKYIEQQGGGGSLRL